MNFYSARYWRINVTANDGSGFVSFAEIELLHGSTDLTTSLSANCSQTGDGGVGSAGDAVDNSDGTEAGSTWAPPYIWKIDLGSSYIVTDLTIKSQGAVSGRTPSTFTLEYSSDNSNWSTALTVANSNSWGILEKRTFQVSTFIISGNITESLDIVDWRVSAHKCKDGSLSGTTTTSGTTYSINCDNTDPCIVTLSPKIDYAWSANKVAALDDYVIPINPETLPHLFKATTAPGDSYWSNVTFLCNCNGSNNSTAFTDISTQARTITANGNAKISTTQSKYGSASAYFDGSGDYITLGNVSSNKLIGPIDSSHSATIEMWVYPTSTSVTGLIDTASSAGATFRNYPSNKIEIQGGSSFDFNLTQNTWQHVAFVFTKPSSSLLIDYYIDGTKVGTTHDYGGSTIAEGIFNFGTINAGGDGSFEGYIDDIRITKIARYTSNFTPPTSQLSAGALTGSSEPSWNLSGTTTDGDITWTYVAPLPDTPLCIGPKIPS